MSVRVWTAAVERNARDALPGQFSKHTLGGWRLEA